MAKKKDSDNDSAINPLDLSQLKDLSFGPDWASDSGKKRSEDSYRRFDSSERRESRKGSFQRGSQDRRSGPRRPRSEGGPRREEGRGERRQATPYEPSVDVVFVSEEKPFELLLKAMRTTHKTYELFEIARIILGKENRFVAIVSPRENATEKKLYVSVPDQLPFETRDEAINHVMAHHLDRFFEVETVEVDPPKGSFPMVNRCKLTGKLLAPPNFHRYQDILKDHYSQNIRNMPFDRFLENVETVREEEVVQEWMDSMKTAQRFTLKQKEGDETPKVVLNTLEDVRYYLTTERLKELVSMRDKVRIPGEKVAQLPKGSIRRTIERELEYQRRFPLITSNHLRGRLRRCHLQFFKKGSKGVTFVCAVKRKHRYKDTVFSARIQGLIDFIEKNPMILVESLVDTYLPEGEETITDEIKANVMQDIRWLVGEGYVTEYGNGALFADKPLPILASEDKQAQAVKKPTSRKDEKSSKKKKKDLASSEGQAAAEEGQPEQTESAPTAPEASLESVSETQQEEVNPEKVVAEPTAEISEDSAAQEEVEQENQTEAAELTSTEPTTDTAESVADGSSAEAATEEAETPEEPEQEQAVQETPEKDAVDPDESEEKKASTDT